MDNIAETLVERGKRYGKFTGHASISQNLLMQIIRGDYAWWWSLDSDQREALQMICHKLGRIANGDPNYADSWVDIAGYAKLVSDRLEQEQKLKEAEYERARTSRDTEANRRCDEVSESKPPHQRIPVIGVNC